MSELSLKIGVNKFDFFNKFDVTLVYNSFASVFSFEGLTIKPEQKNIFRPLSYNEVQVFFGEELLITGTALNTSTSVESTRSLSNISGYSKPGVLEDCEIPVSLYPLQSDGLSLKQITEKLLKPFGLKLIIDPLVTAEANKTYKTCTADPSQKIKDYLTELAKGRNIIITHDSKGNLLFTKLNYNKPSIAFYNEGMPSTKISLAVNGQGMHSEITAQKQVTIEVDSPGEQTVNNALVPLYRPAVVTQTSGDNNDTLLLANTTKASELRNITLTIETDRWRWTDGKKTSIIKPNEIIEVLSPANFINARTRFFVESVRYELTITGIKAVINCVLPEVYSGNTPKNIFI